MSIELAKQLKQHRFFYGLKSKDIDKLAACGNTQTIAANQTIAAEGAPAEQFYALLDGRVAIETHVPGKPSITLQTVEAGDVVGWSWVDAQDWVFDVRTLTTCEVVEFDASAVVEVMRSDSALGFELMRRLNQVVTERLRATRIQLLDIYGRGASGD